MNNKRYAFFILCFLLMAGLLSGCMLSSPDSDKTANIPSDEQPSFQQDQTDADTSATEPAKQTEAPTEPSPVDILLQSMTIREKVGQLFIIQPEALDSGALTATTDNTLKYMEKYPVGGIIMFSKNITSPQQITVFNAALQDASKIPLFLSVDEEGGLVARLARNSAFNLPKYKNAATVGDTADPSAALEMGNTIGAYLRTYGFNMDFAPVADVNTNPKNPVIGTRAFSSDANTAALLARAAADGLSQQGVIPVFKHFPGHGDTAQDSHNGIAITHKSEDELRMCEWIPFQKASSRDCVMIGHIAVPSLTGDNTPATMSPALVTDILKTQLDFNGLVITDSLSMGAITDSYSSAEAALAALQAGCHILLIPQNFQEAFEGVASAVESGTFPESQLDEIVAKILHFKLDHGII